MKIQSLFVLFIFVLTLSSCNQDDPQLNEIENVASLNEYQIVEDKLYFSSSESLKEFINGKSEEEFIETANDLRKKGLNPLTPMFTEGESKLKTSFLNTKSKRLLSKSSLYTSKNQEGSEIDIEDELIKDPRFAALLNEEREIIIENNIYVYTTKGMFYSKLEHEDDLRAYLRTLEGKMANGKYMELEPCLTDEPIAPNVYQSTYCGGGGGGTPTPTPTPTNNYANFPLDIKRNLMVCEVDDSSLWQQVFGPAETCHDYFADDRRAKTTYWNQNYFVFSSIGMSVKHQKRNLWIWDSSNATDYIEMGLTNVSFKYNFNTAVYGEIFRNIQSGVIITWKGKTYTAGGQVIQGYPLQASTLPLDASDNSSITVYLFNDNINIINEQQANNMIRDAARNFISNFGNSLETPISNTSDDVGIDGVIIDPLANSVTYTIVGKTIRRYGASSITKILDFNILVGFKLNLTGGSYSMGENGITYNSGTKTRFEVTATSYTDVTLDMYGVVKRNGKDYRGSRIISDNLD